MMPGSGSVSEYPVAAGPAGGTSLAADPPTRPLRNSGAQASLAEVMLTGVGLMLGAAALPVPTQTNAAQAEYGAHEAAILQAGQHSLRLRAQEPTAAAPANAPRRLVVDAPTLPEHLQSIVRRAAQPDPVGLDPHVRAADAAQPDPGAGGLLRPTSVQQAVGLDPHVRAAEAGQPDPGAGSLLRPTPVQQAVSVAPRIRVADAPLPLDAPSTRLRPRDAFPSLVYPPFVSELDDGSFGHPQAQLLRPDRGVVTPGPELQPSATWEGRTHELAILQDGQISLRLHAQEPATLASRDPRIARADPPDQQEAQPSFLRRPAAVEVVAPTRLLRADDAREHQDAAFADLLRPTAPLVPAALRPLPVEQARDQQEPASAALLRPTAPLVPAGARPLAADAPLPLEAADAHLLRPTEPQAFVAATPRLRTTAPSEPSEVAAATGRLLVPTEPLPIVPAARRPTIFEAQFPEEAAHAFRAKFEYGPAGPPPVADVPNVFPWWAPQRPGGKQPLRRRLETVAETLARAQADLSAPALRAPAAALAADVAAALEARRVSAARVAELESRLAAIVERRRRLAIAFLMLLH